VASSTFDDYLELRELSKTSNCSQSYSLEPIQNHPLYNTSWEYISTHIPELLRALEERQIYRSNDLPLSPLAKHILETKEITVKIVNAGMGTTGTHNTHYCAAARNLSTLHWIEQAAHNSSQIRASLMKHHELYLTLYRCVMDYQINPELWREEHLRADKPSYLCITDIWKEKYIEALIEILTSGVVALHDVPYTNFMPQILALAPNITVVHTLRNPIVWAVRRLKTHFDGSIICARDIMTRKNISSYFNLFECMEGSNILGEHLQGTGLAYRLDKGGSNTEYAQLLFAAKCVEHHRFIRRLVPSSQYFQLCVWDYDFDRKCHAVMEKIGSDIARASVPIPNDENIL
jgi:hypothetical protein